MSNECLHTKRTRRVLDLGNEPADPAEEWDCPDCGKYMYKYCDGTVSTWRPKPVVNPIFDRPAKKPIDVGAHADENYQRWHALALIYGYNELTKLAPTLGEKLYCRFLCKEYEEEYKRLGGKFDLQETEQPVVVIGQHMPHINLYPRDIEMMRKAVADFDAAKEKTDG